MNNSTSTSFSDRLPGIKAALPEWWPIIAGLAVLYVPTFYKLFTGLWTTEAQVHGPIIFFLAIWLLYKKWPLMMKRSSEGGFSAMGWIVFFVGLVLYVIGRAFQVDAFEIGSLIWMLAAILLVKRGGNAIKVVWFSLFFLLFIIPLPGTLVIILTMPMKMAVSYVAEQMLYFVGFPVARNGVVLQIGQYQLLVADACAGLQTLLTLEALGLFYMNVVHHTSALRNIVLAIFIIPISFMANVIRVVSLTLITYYFGEAAGQGFLHGFAGIVLFLSALILIIAMDNFLRFIVKRRSRTSD